MEKSKVYFTDFRAKLGEGLPLKLKRLLKKAGISEIDMENKFVAIKMHFGELGNVSFLRPGRLLLVMLALAFMRRLSSSLCSTEKLPPYLR